MFRFGYEQQVILERLLDINDKDELLETFRHWANDTTDEEIRVAGLKKMQENFFKKHLDYELEYDMESLDQDIANGTIGNTLIESLTYCNRCENPMTWDDYKKFHDDVFLGSGEAYCSNCIDHIHNKMIQAMDNAKNDYVEEENTIVNNNSNNIFA